MCPTWQMNPTRKSFTLGSILEEFRSVFTSLIFFSHLAGYWSYFSPQDDDGKNRKFIREACVPPQSNSTAESRNYHDDVIKWKYFPRYWPFVRGIHRWPANSPYKDQWREALMFSLICEWINGWVNNPEAGDFRRRRAHYNVIVICLVFINTVPADTLAPTCRPKTHNRHNDDILEFIMTFTCISWICLHYPYIRQNIQTF